ncbi:MAG: hypothetical protein KAS21_00035 [Candidatus Aminicenantes bacterium]|nr:hypothetical protein [Candidatus Aminicenantes bacterium]
MNTKIISKISLILLIFSFIILNSCGKRGPLKLDPQIFPAKIKDLTVIQVGNNLKFQWKFPEFLKDNKTVLDISLIKKIYFYYSERHVASISGKRTNVSDIFIKKGRLLKKTDIQQILSNNGEYYFIFPDISGKFLNKKIFTALYYSYNKLSSSLSEINEIKIMLPVKPVRDLSLINENKVIKLKWARPVTKTKKRKSPEIAGFNIFRKIEIEDEKKGTSFVKLNRDIVLKEYFEDKDTGQSGKHNYYISVVVSDSNISEKSNIVSVNIKDIFPPEIPRNILIFKSSNGLMLSWRKVSDKDLSHYKIYRKSGNETDFKVLNTKIIENKFMDDKVDKGVNYSYYITSVDNNGNESDNSESQSELF